MRNKAQEAREQRLQDAIEETRRENERNAQKKDVYTDEEVANILTKVGLKFLLKKVIVPAAIVVVAVATVTAVVIASNKK